MPEPYQPLGRIRPEEITGRATDVITPQAVAQLSDAVRRGVVSAEDIQQRVGAVGQARKKVELQLLGEEISPEAIGARQATRQLQTLAAPIEIVMKRQALQQQLLLSQLKTAGVLEKYGELQKAGWELPLDPQKGATPEIISNIKKSYNDLKEHEVIIKHAEEFLKAPEKEFKKSRPDGFVEVEHKILYGGVLHNPTARAEVARWATNPKNLNPQLWSAEGKPRPPIVFPAAPGQAITTPPTTTAAPPTVPVTPPTTAPVTTPTTVPVTTPPAGATDMITPRAVAERPIVQPPTVAPPTAPVTPPAELPPPDVSTQQGFDTLTKEVLENATATPTAEELVPRKKAFEQPAFGLTPEGGFITGEPAPLTAKALTEFQTRMFSTATRAAATTPVLKQLEDKPGFDPTKIPSAARIAWFGPTEKGRIFAGVAQNVVDFAFGAAGAKPPQIQLTPDEQNYVQARETWVTGVLRQESGAAIRPDEIKTYAAQFFPLAGETKEVQKQKAVNRSAVEGAAQMVVDLKMTPKDYEQFWRNVKVSAARVAETEQAGIETGAAATKSTISTTIPTFKTEDEASRSGANTYRLEGFQGIFRKKQ